MTQQNIPREPYPPEVMGRLGEETYQRNIRRQVEPHHNAQIVAIDVDAQKWALGADEDEACRAATKCIPRPSTSCAEGPDTGQSTPWEGAL